jgi:hypothetical protein
MKGNRAVLTAVVVLILVIAGWWLFKRSSRGPSIDLIATFDAAVKKPAGGQFQVVDADLNGEEEGDLYHSGDPQIWKVKIPRTADQGLSVCNLTPGTRKETGCCSARHL